MEIGRNGRSGFQRKGRKGFDAKGAKFSDRIHRIDKIFQLRLERMSRFVEADFSEVFADGEMKNGGAGCGRGVKFKHRVDSECLAAW